MSVFYCLNYRINVINDMNKLKNTIHCTCHKEYVQFKLLDNNLIFYFDIPVCGHYISVIINIINLIFKYVI